MIIIFISLCFPSIITSNDSESSGPWTHRTYLFLHATDLLSLDDEWSSSTFVLNSSNKCPRMVHTEGLWPTPIAPTFNTDV